MSWLNEAVGEMLKNVPPDVLSDPTYGFGDIERVIALVEKAVARNAEETAAAEREAALKAAADPNHSFIRNPVFATMARDMFRAELTFPRILRASLFMAIYSHTEFLLQSWCEKLSRNGTADQKLEVFLKKKKGEPGTTLGKLLQYLRDAAKLDLGDYEKWPEWEAICGYGRARNCLAHNGGIIDRDGDAEKIGKLPCVEIDASGLLWSEPRIDLLPGACEAAAATTRAFIHRAVESLERDPRRKKSP